MDELKPAKTWHGFTNFANFLKATIFIGSTALAVIAIAMDARYDTRYAAKSVEEEIRLLKVQTSKIEQQVSQVGDRIDDESARRKRDRIFEIGVSLCDSQTSPEVRQLYRRELADLMDDYQREHKRTAPTPPRC